MNEIFLYPSGPVLSHNSRVIIQRIFLNGLGVGLVRARPPIDLYLYVVLFVKHNPYSKYLYNLAM